MKQFLFVFSQSFWRYALVGGIGTLIDIFTLTISVEFFGLSHFWGVTFGFIFAVIHNFFLNKYWTFGDTSTKNMQKQMGLFLLVSLIGFGVNMASFWLYMHIFHWYVIAKLGASATVLIWNFYANQKFTFKKNIPLPIEVYDEHYDVSIIIPCYNEQNRILKTLKELELYLAKQNYKSEIILVNDGSTDNTVNNIETLALTEIPRTIIHLAKNMGKGAAVRQGVFAATGRYLVFMDADGSTPIDELSKMMKYLKSGNKIVIGSRYQVQAHITKKQPILRRMMSRIGNALIQLLIVQGIKDTQCGFKGFETLTAKQIFSLGRIDRWGFDFEILFIAKKYQLTAKEIPVSWQDVAGSHLRGIDIIKTLLDLPMIHIFNLLGIYTLSEGSTKSRHHFK